METKQNRLLSLDVFRGITIMGMIVVNNPGSWSHIYPALDHAKWHGVTPTDLIFPFFLFMVGITTYFSLSRRKESGENLKVIYLQIIKRSVILFILGLILASFPFFPLEKYIYTIRIPGVLQRIAIVYLITSIIFLKTSNKTQIIISFTLLIFYWMIMTLVPVPGVGYPNLDKFTNLGVWLDKLVFGVNHLWIKDATILMNDGTIIQKSINGSWLYDTEFMKNVKQIISVKSFDPEGLLSTIPAISTALFGVMTGRWIKSNRDENEKVLWMFVIGNFALVISMFMDMWFPINKSLWTSSYVVYTTGMALIFFAMCYFLVDMEKITWWTKPFLIYGTNAITVFFLSGIMARLLNIIIITQADGKTISLKNYLYNSLFTWWLSPINSSLAWAIMYVLIWLAIMSIFYKKKIFIKI
jgi:predicted acyltransferase